MRTNNKLNAIYFEAGALNDEIPAELAKKIVLYSESLRYIGANISEATFLYGKSQNERKKKYALAIVNVQGTVAEKEAKAELSIEPYRKQEIQAESELVKWKHAYQSTQELINALKKQLEVLMQEWGGDQNGTG